MTDYPSAKEIMRDDAAEIERLRNLLKAAMDNWGWADKERISATARAEKAEAELRYAVVLPEGKIGDYVERNNGVCMRLFQIHYIIICHDGIRYDLGDFTPFVNHSGINRILTRSEAEAALAEKGGDT